MIFLLKTLKNYIARCDFGAVDILSTDSLTCGIINFILHFGGLQWEII